MKKITRCLTLLLAFGLFVALMPETAEAARYRTVRFKLTSSAKIAWGRLYINGRYRGQVRRNSYKRVRLRTGRSYRVTVRRSWNGRNWYRNKSVYVSSSSSRYQTVFLHPTARGGNYVSDGDSGSRYRSVRFKLTSSSKIAWGRLYINGSYKGRVRRSGYLRVRLRTGRTYRVRVRRYWNGENWERNKSFFLSRSSSSTKTVFLHPMAR